MRQMRLAALFVDGCSQPLCHSVWLAEHARQRLRGLLCRPPLTFDEALFLKGVRSIHMFGMRVPIDVVFLDSTLNVTDTRQGLRPNRTCMGSAGTRHTLEMAAGMVDQHGIVRGTRVHLRADAGGCLTQTISG